MFTKKARKYTGYVSEFTQFVDTFLKEHPEVVENQRQGWYIFWDHEVDLDELKKAEADSVAFEKTMPEPASRQGTIH